MRAEAEEVIGTELHMDDFIDVMLRDEGAWTVIDDMITRIMAKKEARIQSKVPKRSKKTSLGPIWRY